MAAVASSPALLTLSANTLRDAALRPSTHRAYSNNVNKFLRYTRLSLPKLLQRPPSEIDARLAQYFEAQFAARGSYHNANHALFGLIFRCPRLKAELGEARLRLRGWRRLIKDRPHPPITWELAVLFAVTMAKWGRHAEAMGTLLSFDCYLRVGELTRLRYSDVAMPNDPRMGSAHVNMALRLAVTKTGANQWVALGDATVARLFRLYLTTFPFMAGDLVFPFSPSSFRGLLRQVAGLLGLGDIPYVPHSFRHGGATRDFLRGATIEQIMFRGRWESMKSAKRYVQTARALLMLLDIPDRAHGLGSVLSRDLEAVIGLLWESVPRHMPAYCSGLLGGKRAARSPAAPAPVVRAPRVRFDFSSSSESRASSGGSDPDFAPARVTA